MRRGYKTTEFYATVAFTVGTVTASLAGALPSKYAALATSISVAGFGVARGLAKVVNSGD